MWVFYAPIVVYITYLAIRFRGLSFLSVNPGLPMSGLIGERKAQSLLQLTDSPFLARFEMIPEDSSLASRISQAKSIMQHLGVGYPIVLKPDFGQRGADVAVIRSDDEIRDYLNKTSTDAPSC